MGVDGANVGTVQLVSLRASWLVYVYFLLGLWPSCSRSRLAPWACHVTWTCVCSGAAQVLSFLFSCVCQRGVRWRCVFLFCINVWTYTTLNYSCRIKVKMCPVNLVLSQWLNRPLCVRLHYSTQVFLSIKRNKYTWWWVNVWQRISKYCKCKQY